VLVSPVNANYWLVSINLISEIPDKNIQVTIYEAEGENCLSKFFHDTIGEDFYQL
jgi:hypothetical protein